MLPVEPMYPLAGLGVGVMVGMTGVGGGALMTPILVLLFGVQPVAAVGTDLWFAAITKIVGGAVHHQGNNRVDSEVLGRLLAGSLPASVLTLLGMHLLGAGRYRSGLILTSLGVVLALTAAAMLFRGRLQDRLGRLPQHWAGQCVEVQGLATVAAGAILGVLVTLTSVGAGALGAVLLMVLYPFRMTSRRIVSTDIVHAIPLALVAGIGHLLMGHVDLALLMSLLIGSLPGVYIGARLSVGASDKLLRTCIAFLLAAVAGKILYT